MVKPKVNRHIKRIVLLLLMNISLIFLTSCSKKIVYSPKPSREALVNPMMGFVPWAKDHENVTEENTLVYVDLTWREWEPEPGVYDYEYFEQINHLEQWRNEGKRVVFRFVCDRPGDEEHMDIPDWLYEKTDKKGDFYDTSYGKGYAPDYSDPELIHRHELAIKALANRYGKDGFFCFIQLGSLGHWGEWHVKYQDGITRMPKAEIRDQYVKHYLKYFTNTKLMMRRPFAIAAQKGLGLYNDMTGSKEATEEWLGWIDQGGAYSQAEEGIGALLPMKDGWKRAPIGGEFTTGMSMVELLNTKLDTTLELLRRSHTTFIGPNTPVEEDINDQTIEGIESIQSLIGYRLRIQELVCTIIPIERKLQVHLDWVNDGLAPMYYNWETKLYLMDESGEVIKEQVVDVDLTKVLPDETVDSDTVFDLVGVNKGKYQIGLAIIDPISKEPAVMFAMENNPSDRIYIFDIKFEFD